MRFQVLMSWVSDSSCDRDGSPDNNSLEISLFSYLWTVIPFVTGILTQFTILSVGESRVMSENDRPFTSFFATHVSLTQSLPAERSLVATLRSEERWTPKERETRDVRRSRSRNSLSYRLTISFTFLLFHLIYSASPPTYHLHPTHHMRPLFRWFPWPISG